MTDKWEMYVIIRLIALEYGSYASQNNGYYKPCVCLQESYR